MKGFKQYLLESHVNNAAVGSLDVRRFDVDDLMKAYSNAGASLKNEHQDWADVVWGGYDKKRKEHTTWLLYLVDESDDETTYSIKRFFVYLGENGKVHAEDEGKVAYSGLGEKEGTAKLKSLQAKF